MHAEFFSYKIVQLLLIYSRSLTVASSSEPSPLIRQSTETFHPSYVEQIDGSTICSPEILNLPAHTLLYIFFFSDHTQLSTALMHLYLS